MKNILLPTDFSDNSWSAIAYALQLLKNEPCKFYILHTYIPTIFNIEYVLVSPAQFGLGDAIRETALNNLKLLKDKIKTTFKNPKHQFETIASFNNLILEIKDLVASKNIDYIIMGTKGATGTAEVLFGTNTIHVLNNAQCPVLAIPENFEYESPFEILFPTDLNLKFIEKHIEPLKEILKHFNSRINILHVYYGEELTVSQKENKKKLENLLEQQAYLYHESLNQNVDDAINIFQVKTKVNLLVMINNKHSFFENIFFKSKVNAIGFHLNIPFLVIPSKFK